jgi:hypothetical protein
VVSVFGNDGDGDVEQTVITVATTSRDRAAGLDRRVREILQSITPAADMRPGSPSCLRAHTAVRGTTTWST